MQQVGYGRRYQSGMKSPKNKASKTSLSSEQSMANVNQERNYLSHLSPRSRNESAVRPPARRSLPVRIRPVAIQQRSRNIHLIQQDH